MKLQDVKKPEDILNFIEGCLNDMEAGVSSKNETVGNMVDLISYLIKEKEKNLKKEL